MTERNKNILLAVLIVGVVSMTVAFAALSQNLNINGSASVQNLNESWNIHFAHISNTSNEVKTSGYASADSSITVENTTVTVPEVALKAPGDKVEYLFKVVNEGDITGYINVLNNIGFGTITYDKDETLTPEQKTAFQNDIQVTLTYSNGTSLAYNDVLLKGDESELLLTIEYINRDSAQVLPTKDVTFTGISATVTYGQDRTSLSGSGDVPSNPTIVQTNVITLDNDSAASAGTSKIYERYNTGYYLDSNLSTQMSTSENGIIVPTKAGYVFGGYYTEENGEGIQYIDENGLLTSSASVTNFNTNGVLYAKWEINEFSMTAMCPGCVFTKKGGLYIDGYGTPNTLDGVSTTSDYLTLNSNYFWGYVSENGYIKRSFTCGIEKGEAFCLEGTDASKYSYNRRIILHFFPNCSIDSSYVCNGTTVYGVRAEAGGGDVSVWNSSRHTYLIRNGLTWD